MANMKCRLGKNCGIGLDMLTEFFSYISNNVHQLNIENKDFAKNYVHKPDSFLRACGNKQQLNPILGRGTF